VYQLYDNRPADLRGLDIVICLELPLISERHLELLLPSKNSCAPEHYDLCLIDSQTPHLSDVKQKIQFCEFVTTLRKHDMIMTMAPSLSLHQLSTNTFLVLASQSIIFFTSTKVYPIQKQYVWCIILSFKISVLLVVVSLNIDPKSCTTPAGLATL